MRARAFAAALAAVALVAAVSAAGAAAEVQTIDFEAAPLNAPFGGQGDIVFRQDLGFRPYATEVGARAQSGTRVGDAGRCFEETGRSCEFFQANTTVELARTAESVTVFVGRFGPIAAGEAPEQAVLTAFSADGSIVGLSRIEIGDEGFKRRLQVLRLNQKDITRFTIRANSGVGGTAVATDLGFDDLSVSFADGGTPDFSVAATGEVVGVPQGEEVEVPVRVSRINGSNGTITLAVSDLPAGVSAAPVELKGTATEATLKLRAEPNAPDTDFVPAEATIIAESANNPAVGPANRSTPLAVRVGRAFQLRSGDTSDADEGEVVVELPSCAAVDVPLEIARDPALERTVTLSARQDLEGATLLPPGISGEFLSGPEVPPGGGLVAERTLRLRAGPGAGLFRQPRSIVVEARVEPGEAPHALRLRLIHTEGASVSRVTPAFRAARTPRFGQPGATVRLNGQGFCEGTTVLFGSDQTRTPTRLVDEHALEFTVPRYAVSGELTVIPPDGGRSYPAGRLSVDSVRNGDAFAFKNYPFGTLGLAELERAFGSDDIFVSVNPCWPFGNCTVQTGFLSPVAALDWGVLQVALRRSNGHCFGINLSLQQLASRKVPLSFYTRAPGAQPFDIPGPGGPEASLETLLDANHARQFSEEFLGAFFKRPRGLNAQLDVLRREFGISRMPMIQIYRGLRAHSVLAYDLVETASTARIYVYDNASPFAPEEEFDPGRHRTKVEAGVIAIDKAAGTWTYEGASGWSGASGDGSLWVTPFEANPDDPSLPGRDTLVRAVSYVLLGSLDGAVRSDAGAYGEFLPDAGEEADAAGNGAWVAPAGKPLDVTVTGTKDGRYTQTYTAPSFVASVGDVATAKGVRDKLSGAGEGLRFESGKARVLEIELAKEWGKGLTSAATVRTHASAGGADSAGFAKGGALVYAHDGAATSVEFSLTAVRPNGGPSTFESGPVAVRDGDLLLARPLGRDLSRVRLAIRGANGRKVSRVLRDRKVAGRLRIGKPKATAKRLTLPFKLSGLRGRAVVGASLRLMRGNRTVARKALSLRSGKGSHRVAWELPRGLKRGEYRLVAQLRALTLGARGSTVSDSVTSTSNSQLKIPPK
ncbi:MAG TPA: hypothetical protein VMS60_15190 [Solirubrobacterales bacterium]|nr:hypothetical protein [Solirubrobacterales bacterium]